MSGAAPSKTACAHPAPSIPAEELQFCTDEQKMCQGEVWTQELELITTDPHLELDLQNKHWGWLRQNEVAKSILQRLLRDFQAHLRKPCFLLDSLKTSREQLQL